MPQYKSNITKMVARTNEITWEDLTEDIFGELSKVFEEESVKQGIYTSEEELSRYAGVATYLMDHDEADLKMYGVTVGDVEALKDDPKTAIYREYREKIHPIYDAKDMEEFDQALLTCEEFLHRTLHIEPGQLEFRIVQVLQRESEWIRETVEIMKRKVEETRGIKFDELDPSEKIQWADFFEDAFGTRGTPERTQEPTIIPFDPTKGKRK